MRDLTAQIKKVKKKLKKLQKRQRKQDVQGVVSGEVILDGVKDIYGNSCIIKPV